MKEVILYQWLIKLPSGYYELSAPTAEKSPTYSFGEVIKRIDETKFIFKN